MAKQKSSSGKRDREMKKRDRERKKREKVAARREARQNKRNETEFPAPGGVAVTEPGARRSEEKDAASPDA
jgi:hypothetical protein